MMFEKYKGVLLITLWLLSPWGQAVAAPLSAATKPLEVTTSIHPLGLIAGELFAEMANIQLVFASDADPHHQSLAFSQIGVIKKADLVVWLGPQLEGALEKLLSDHPRALGVGQQLDESDEEQHLHHDHQDLHIWMDPQMGVGIAEAIVAFTTSRYPEYTAALEKSLSGFKARTEQTERDISEYLLTLNNPSYVADHNAFSHFSERFELHQRGSLHDASGVRIGPSDYIELLNIEGVDCVVAEPRYDQASVERFAHRLGAPVVEVDPLGALVPISDRGYQAFLLSVADAFGQCVTH